jgi:uncharacterized protein
MTTQPSEALGICPFTIDRPAMRHRWERLTFLHWPFDPADVQRLLPSGLEVETWDGAAWVGLVPFYMRVATPAGHRVPWLSNFCETNVRTYARDRAGQSGVWFLSLDAARLPAVVTGRYSPYRLPYFWSSMRLGERPDEIAYTSRRRWPGPRSAVTRVRIGIGAPIDPSEVTPFEHFLTARWRLFSAPGGRVVMARARHEPWPLYRARPLLLEDTLLTSAGLTVPEAEPLVHYSPGVDVTIGRPER